MKKLQKTLLAGALAMSSYQVAALPFGGVDARSISMGGTGVASGSIVNASTFNPALLAAYREDEDFNFSLALGIVARDEDEMLDAIDDLQTTNFAGNDVIQQFSSDMTDYQNVVTAISGGCAGNITCITTGAAPEITAVQASAADLTTALNNLGNKPIEIGFNAGFNLSIPSETLGVSIFANSRAIIAGSLQDVDLDTVEITNIVNELTSPTSYASLTGLTDPFAGGTNTNSKLVLNGGAVTETGVALATKIAGIAIGVTPKILRIDTVESATGIGAVDTNNLDDTGETFEDANFDVGIAIDLGALKIGAVGKNMIEQEYTLTNSVVPGTKVVIEPQLRAGVAFDAGWATLTMDQDLTENKGVITNDVIGNSQDTQYTSLGIEFDLSLVQIRAGYRTNNLDSTGDSDVLTAGIGIHALVTADLAVAQNDQGIEAVIQVGMRW